MDSVQSVVVGAGVVGLAVARALAQSGHEVLLLESAAAIGTGVSSRNSEVIHAGLYYPTGSLKARLCVRGRELLYDYCAQRHIGHQRLGKLVVATAEAQLPQLRALAQQAQANGVTDLQYLDAAQARQLEPELELVAALHSPSTGIVDSHALMLSLLADFENAAGLLVLNTVLESARRTDAGLELRMQDGTALLARNVVNAAGLNAVAVAQSCVDVARSSLPRAYYAKGSYFSLSTRAPFQRLIYPVPEPGGLGIHLTLDLGHQARFGPDVQWLACSSTAELQAQDWTVDPNRAAAFEASVRQYWPGLPAGALQAAYVGIRPKISAPEQAAADFLVQTWQHHGVPGWVNLLGIESPGLTSALAIGEWVCALFL